MVVFWNNLAGMRAREYNFLAMAVETAWLWTFPACCFCWCKSNPCAHLKLAQIFFSENTKTHMTTTTTTPDEQLDNFQFEEIVGDLFSCTDCICHCVSEDLNMGKGIAVIFKEKFGQVDFLKSQQAKTGGMCLLQDENGRFVYYLVTKPKYYLKPTYATLRSSLTLMRDHAVANKVAHIGMPLLGCGLDRLQWAQVKQMLYDLFSTSGIAITVYKLSADADKQQPAALPNSRGGRGGRKKKRGTSS